MTLVVSTLAVILLSIIVLAFELGGMAPANAFFWAAFVLIGFTAYQFVRFEGWKFSDAARAIFLPGKGGVLSFAYLSYIGVAAVSALVAIQAVVVA